MGFPLTRFYNKEESIKYCFILVFTNLQDGKKKKIRLTGLYILAVVFVYYNEK